MILVRAPLRISFIGGGTDLPGFYRKYPGRVISTTIDKFVYLVIKPTKLVNRFIVKYQKTEVAKHPSELQHSRIRAALLHMNITDEGVEIGSFADIPAKSGLGSSSSFSVALMKGLNTYVEKKTSLSRRSAVSTHSSLIAMNRLMLHPYTWTIKNGRRLKITSWYFLRASRAMLPVFWRTKAPWCLKNLKSIKK